MYKNYENEPILENVPSMILDLMKQTREMLKEIQELKSMQSEKPELKVYSVKIAAEVLRMKPETLRSKIRNKEIGASDTGKGYLLTQEDINKYLRSIHSNSFYESNFKYGMN